MQFDQIAACVSQYYPDPDLNILKRAFDFAEEAHAGQVRASGEPYFNHLAETALIACQLKLDLPSICAALLHDTLEDCSVEPEDLKQKFGEEIRDIVEGVTKLTRIEFDSKEERQAENFRKMLIAMAKDIRVVLVKLCDRLHNMRTLSHLSLEKQLAIAKETKDIYAPLANRLGIHWLKSELEDLCFRYLRPELMDEISKRFVETKAEREAYIARVCNELTEILSKAGISASVTGRSKHFYSIWQKMEEQNLTFDEIHDLLGFRVIVPAIRGCYETLGIIHATWKPVPGRFKDYIAMPKPNHYQSLHTTVIGPEGRRVEIQIRTLEMHKIAEDGIAAHWRYKEGGARSQAQFDLKWVSELVETQQYLRNPDEFIQSVKSELFPEEIFVFTPKGDVMRLPYGASPIDFAYSVHTDVGHHIVGARCNGTIVPINHSLENGDTVEVMTSKSQVPNKDWLGFVKSSKAKQRIRAFLKSHERARSLAIGMEILSKDLRKVKLSLKKLEKEGKLLTVAQSLGLKGEGDLYAEIGYGKLGTAKVLSKVLPEGTDVEEKLQHKPSPLERIFQRAAKASRQKVGVRVAGLDDVLVRFAKCCEPLPGDRIVGFITRGRGVTVHYADCAQVMQSDPLRSVEVQWDTDVKAPRKVNLTVHSQDVPGILASMTQAISTNGANITSAQVKTTGYGKATNSFEVLIDDARQLEKMIRNLEKIPGVIKVERVRHLTAAIDVPSDKESKKS